MQLYQSADDHLKSTLPPAIDGVQKLVPLLLAAQVMLQHSLVGELYRVMLEYCQRHRFPEDPSMDEVVTTWGREYYPLKDEVESGIKMIAGGKAIHQPMTLPETSSSLSIRDRMGQKRTSSQGSVPRMSQSPGPRRVSQDMLLEESPPARPPRPGGSSTALTSRPRVPSSMSILSQETLVEDEELAPVKPPRPGQTPGPIPFGGKPRTGSNISNGSVTVNTFGRNLDPTTPSALNGLSRRDSPQTTPYLTPTGTGQPPAAGTDYFTQAHDRRQSSSSIASSIAGKKKPPAPPVKKKPSFQAQFVTALYDFTGQGEGDLSFREGQQIRVVKKSDSTDDWWLGELDGVQGSFPANYVKL